MPPSNLLTYERRPVGRVLVDEDPDGVTIRVFTESRTPWGTVVFFAFAGIGGVGGAVEAAHAGNVGKAVVFGTIGALSLLAMAWVIFEPSADPITFRATLDGLEYHHAVFGEASISREEIADVVVVPGENHRPSTLCLLAPDGTAGALGVGAPEEVAAIAEAMRKGLGIGSRTSSGT